jgi:hypothetical protein
LIRLFSYLFDLFRSLNLLFDDKNLAGGNRSVFIINRNKKKNLMLKIIKIIDCFKVSNFILLLLQFTIPEKVNCISIPLAFQNIHYLFI